MNAHLLRAAVLLAFTASSGAFAQDLIEKVVVRNRLYSVQGRWEVGPSFGLSLVNRLTNHYNLNLGVAYNVTNTVAFEARGGWAMSGHTGLADQVGQQLLQRNPATEVTTTSDLSRLWVMKGNGLFGARWAPLYGKINLVAELPIHFQSYLWAGGGAAQLQRESVVVCQQVESRADGSCANWLTEDTVSWLGSGAFGLRFFTAQYGGLKLELRNYLYPDKYLVDINRQLAEQGQQTGTEAQSPGLINLMMFDIGYTVIF